MIARDFAHHPTAVEAVLEAAAVRWPGVPLTAVFEPRSFTARSAWFQDRFVASFRGAARVLLASDPGESRGRRPEEASRLDLDRLAADLGAEGIPAEVRRDHGALIERVARLAGASGRGVFLFLSNGHFGAVPEQVARMWG